MSLNVMDHICVVGFTLWTEFTDMQLVPNIPDDWLHDACSLISVDSRAAEC